MTSHFTYPRPHPPGYPEEPANEIIHLGAFTKFEKFFWTVVLLAVVFIAGYQAGLNAERTDGRPRSFGYSEASR